MTTCAVDDSSLVDPIWKDRIERTLKHVCRAIDLRQRRDAGWVCVRKTQLRFSSKFCFSLVCRILFHNLAKKSVDIRRPRLISTPLTCSNDSPTLYTNCSIDELTGEELRCSLTILPQTDQLPAMFTYVSLQHNILVRKKKLISIRSSVYCWFQCDTPTNLSDVLLEEDDDDIKTLLNSTQTEINNSRLPSVGSSRRTRRISKSSSNKEFHFDDEHLIELLKRLKQHVSNDELNLFETLISRLVFFFLFVI